MPVALPQLSREQWSQRLYDAQVKSLFPVEFIFLGGSRTSTGGLSYITQSYVVPSFCGLAQIDANEAFPFVLGNVVYEYAVVSLNTPPNFADATTAPAEEGNIIYSQAVAKNQIGKPQTRNFYPGIIPLHKGQTLYISSVQTPIAGSTTEAMVVILHFLQTGLLI